LVRGLGGGLGQAFREIKLQGIIFPGIVIPGKLRELYIRRNQRLWFLWGTVYLRCSVLVGPLLRGLGGGFRSRRLLRDDRCLRRSGLRFSGNCFLRLSAVPFIRLWTFGCFLDPVLGQSFFGRRERRGCAFAGESKGQQKKRKRR